MADIKDTVAALKKLDNDGSSFELCAGVMAHIRRAPLGVILVLGPFNYPLNETYTLAIPGLIMGNTLVMKLPRTGVLCHMPTLAAFQKCFPPGVVNIIAGSRLSYFFESTYLTLHWSDCCGLPRTIFCIPSLVMTLILSLAMHSGVNACMPRMSAKHHRVGSRDDVANHGPSTCLFLFFFFVGVDVE